MLIEYPVKGEDAYMSIPPGKTTFTLAEAAELLSCHKETLRRAIARGVLRAAKLGNSYRVSRVDLEGYWAASGGGALFAKDGAGVFEPAKSSSSRKKGSPMQLPLPGTATGIGEK